MYDSLVPRIFISYSEKSISHEYFKTFFISLTLILSIFVIFGKTSPLEQHRQRKRRDKLLRQLPHVKNYGVLGSLPHMFHLLWNPCQDFLPWMESVLREKLAPYFVLWVQYQPKMVVVDPEISIDLLRHKLKSRATESLQIGRLVGGEGILTLDEANHAIRRKMWMPGFSRAVIDNSLRIFRQEGRSLCKTLEPFQKTGEEFNLMWPCIHATFRTIAYSAFGEEYMNKLPESVGLEHSHLLHTMSLNLSKRAMARPWLSNDWIYLNLTYDGYISKKCIQRGSELAKRAVVSRKLLRSRNKDKANQKAPCFLDLLLDFEEAGKITKDELVQDLNFFIVAGYDTTGITIMYLLYLLSLHPEYQVKVLEELQEIFGEDISSHEEITPMQLNQMKFLEMCIKETLRIYSTVPLTFRRTIEDTTLSDGKIIPEGTDVYIALQLLHKNEKYFPEPEKFLPERHIVPIAAWMPFAVGSRNCIGQVYAMQEIKVFAAHLLMMYKWETLEKPNLETLVHALIIPKHGIRFNITKR